jgi:hypothetical protein
VTAHQGGLLSLHLCGEQWRFTASYHYDLFNLFLLFRSHLAIMELWKTENMMALLFCALIWLISYSFHRFAIPLPAQPSSPAVYSFPADILALGLLSMTFKLNPIPIVVGGYIGQFLYGHLAPQLSSAHRNLPGPFLARFTRFVREFWELLRLNSCFMTPAFITQERC